MARHRAHRILLVVLCLAALGSAAIATGCGGDDATRSAATSGTGSNWINDLYRRLSPGVVFIQAQIVRVQRSPFGARNQRGIATGSGFAYDDQGHVVTNAHVVENAKEVALRVEGNRLIPAKVVGVDRSTDLAVLKVDPRGLTPHPLTLGDSGDVEVGDAVLAIGNPFGLEDTVTNGIVSARHRRITAPNGLRSTTSSRRTRPSIPGTPAVRSWTPRARSSASTRRSPPEDSRTHSPASRSPSPWTR